MLASTCCSLSLMQYQCLCVASHKNNLIDVHSVSSHIKSVNIDWHCTCDKVNTPINSATQIIHHQVKRFINKVVPNGLSHHCWAHIGTPFHKEPASLPPFSGTRCKGSKLMVYMETCKRACYSCFFAKQNWAVAQRPRFPQLITLRQPPIKVGTSKGLGVMLWTF